MPSQEPAIPKVSHWSTARKARRGKQSSSMYRVRIEYVSCAHMYRVRNWAAYAQALKQRGQVTVWFSPEAVQAWAYQGPAQRGVQFVYSDLLDLLRKVDTPKSLYI